MGASEAKEIAEASIVKSQSEIILSRVKSDAQKGLFKSVWGVMHPKTKDQLIGLGYNVEMDIAGDMVVSWNH